MMKLVIFFLVLWQSALTSAFIVTLPVRSNPTARTHQVLMSSSETSEEPQTPRRRGLNLARGLLQGGVALVSGLVISNNMPNPLAAKNGKYPIVGSEDIMSSKAHGTSISSVQSSLQWGCDVKLADRICNYNRNWAEHFGYWQQETKFLSQVDRTGVTTFYDSVTGLPLFRAPIGRSFDEWEKESLRHGWPSFRDEEVVWDNVRTLRDGEAVSLTGTHLGHNLPDFAGNRYCINLVSIAGYPNTTPVSSA